MQITTSSELHTSDISASDISQSKFNQSIHNDPLLFNLTTHSNPHKKFKHGIRIRRNPVVLGLYNAISFIARSISRLFATASRPAIHNAITMAGTRVLHARPISLATLARGPVASIRYGMHLASRTYQAGSTAISRLFSPVTNAFQQFKLAHPILSKAISRGATVSSLAGNSYFLYEIIRLDQLRPTEKELHWTKAGRRIVEELRVANNFTQTEAEEELESIGESLIQGYLAVNAIVTLNRQALHTEKFYERPFFGTLPKVPPVVEDITVQPTIQDETLLFTSMNKTDLQDLKGFLTESHDFYGERKTRMIPEPLFRKDNSSYFAMKKEGKKPIVVPEHRLEFIDDVLNTDIRDVTLPPPLDSLPISSLLDLLMYIQDCNTHVFLDICRMSYNEIISSLEKRPSTLSTDVEIAIKKHKEEKEKEKELQLQRDAELKVQEEKRVLQEQITLYGAIAAIPLTLVLLVVIVILGWKTKKLQSHLHRLPRFYPSPPESYSSGPTLDRYTRYDDITLHDRPNTERHILSLNP